MPNLRKILQKRAQYSPDLAELVIKEEPILFFDAVHFKREGAFNPLIQRSDVEYVGRACSIQSEELVFKTSKNIGGDPVVVCSPASPYGVVSGDLFQVSSTALSIVDRCLLNGFWFNRHAIQVLHRDSVSGRSNVVEAFTFLANTKYWKDQNSEMRYLRSNKGDKSTNFVPYFEHHKKST